MHSPQAQSNSSDSSRRDGSPPAAPTEERNICSDAGQAVADSVPREIIMAVDDNPAVLATVAIQLRNLGYTVIEAKNGRTALEILDQIPRVDLLFTDLVMPGGMTGKELATEARRRHPGLKVLFTSGYAGPIRNNAVELDDEDVLLSKPYRRRDLDKAIRASLTAQVLP
jgi:CheY-like chemotaxis protein